MSTFTPPSGELRYTAVELRGESGPGARPAHPDWFRSVRDQCADASVPFFFKQWGEFAYCEQRGDAFTSPNGYWPVGRVAEHTWEYSYFDYGAAVRVGKKVAGDLLDGVEHHEFPEVRS